MLLTLIETCRRLGVSEKVGREIVRSFPSVRVGKRLRYTVSAVEEFAKAGSTAKTQPENQAA